MRQAFAGAFMTVVFASGLFGQAQSGTVVGTVTDQAGGVVPGIEVTLTNEGTQSSRTVKTNQAGQYVVYAFPTGRITATVAHPGFQRLVRSGVELTAADILTVNLTLRVGDVVQTVEVTGEASLLQTQTAAVSSLISNQQMLEMPLNGRTFTQLLQLGTGTIAASLGMQSGTAGYGMRGNTNVSVNGSIPSNNSYVIDGLFNRGLWLNNLVIVPTIDSIQEVRVMSSNYSAEYGSAAGAVTVVQSKSGTNSLHGSVYEFLRNDMFDANTFFNNKAEVDKPPFRRNEFGGTVGGPVRRDQTFFFADYQGIRVRRPQTYTVTIPTLAQRAMVKTGDFSGLGVAVYDPYTLVPGPGNTQVRAPFSGNKISPALLDPAAAKVMDLLPEPTSSGTTRNLVSNPLAQQRVDQFDIRLDQNIGSADRLFFKYSYDNSTGSSPGRVPAAQNTGVPIGPYVASGGGQVSTLKNWATGVNFTKVIGTALVNETRLGAVRWNQYFAPWNLEYNTAAAIGIPGVNINDRSGGLPDLNISGFQGLGEGSQYPEKAPTISYQIEDILTVVQGSHTLKFGGNYIRHIFNGFTVQQPRGLYSFSGQFTRQIGAGGAARALADFALGAFSAANRGILTGTFGMRFWNASAFADDTWRVNRRLTVNFGLRYELQAPPHEVHDHWANFDIFTARIKLAGLDGNSRALRSLDRNNFAPRLGITYLLTSDSRTVLRTGFGMSYVESFNAGKQLYQNLPFAFQQVFTTDQAGEPARRLSDGFPTPAALDLNDIVQLSGGSPSAWDQRLQTPKTMQWSFGIQREVVSNVLLDVSYVGTRTLLIHNQLNPNQSVPGPGAQGPRRPMYAINPLVTNIDYRTNWGAAKYHSFQARVQKRASYGLTLSTGFTWSHNLSNTRGVNTSTPPQDVRCTRCEWGNATEDRRLALVMNHVYELPFGEGRHFVNTGPLSYIIGNWDISGIWTIYSGSYSTPSLASPVSNSTGGGTQRPDRIRDGNLPPDQRTIDRWFDIEAFGSPQQYTFGNAAKGILEGPGYFNVDTAVQRMFSVGEHWRLSLRWEMFNTFNRPNFSSPNASIGSSSAGQISSTAAARIMQVALKLTF